MGVMNGGSSDDERDEFTCVGSDQQEPHQSLTFQL